ncbi:hypothetical protein HRED_10684 [Candidatus Haloredivivus sp. G17]|nr:hypothetical protein HRED_10684 [Candidatus Haloredivivus sp. G17]
MILLIKGFSSEVTLLMKKVQVPHYRQIVVFLEETLSTLTAMISTVQSIMQLITGI